MATGTGGPRQRNGAELSGAAGPGTRPGGSAPTGAVGGGRRRFSEARGTPRALSGAAAAQARAGIRRRATWLGVWCGLALTILALRLVDVQVVHAKVLAGDAQRQYLTVTPIPAQRGEIVDRSGAILAVSQAAADIWADQGQITNKPAAARALAGVLDLTEPTLLKLLQSPGQYLMLEQDATAAQGQAVQRLGIFGVYVNPTTVRTYPDGSFLAHVLGFVGANGQGLSGVELTYNRELAGQNGEIVQQTGLFGNPLPELPIKERPAVQGLTLQLTIDGGLQRILAAQLEAAVATTKANAAYGVVLQPGTGDILAMSSWPTYDPNHYGDVPPSVWDNTAWGTDLVPGSVFKPITTSAALSLGVVTPSTPFYDPGYITVDGATLHNFEPLEIHTTFQRALDESANVIFAHVGLRMGLPRFYSYLRAFGLFGPTGVDLPGEQLDIFRPLNQATQLTLAEESFGESVEVTPLSLATALGAIADGGVLVRPHVGLALLAPNGKRVKTIAPVVVRRVISPAVAATVRQMMVGVVANGTGQRGFIPCYNVAGKTGTSNIYGNGVLLNNFIASFVEMAPASHPAALVVVMLVNPKGWFNEGGEVAAPVAQTVLAAALHRLGVPPHCTTSNAAPPLPGAPGTTAQVLYMVTMPSIVNLSPRAAVAATDAVGIVLHVHGTGPRVLTQIPPPGAQVQQWTSAEAYTRPNALVPGSFIRVPDLRGDTIAQATSALIRVGLALNAQGVGTAISQDPAAGTSAGPGTGVTVQFAGPG